MHIVEGYTLMNEQYPEPRWAIDSIIPEGGALLAGRPKTGKSWLALNIAVAVASGGVALGKIPVEKGEVLYLALEDSFRRLQARLRKLLEAQRMTMPTGMFFATDWPRAAQGGLNCLAQWIKSHALARLIVIDTLARFRSPNSIRGSHYDEDYAAFGEIQKVAINHGVAILGATHTRKPKPGANEDQLDEVQNSSGLTGAADAVLTLKRLRMTKNATLFITGRDVEEREIPLAVDEEFCLWTITTPDHNDPDARATPEQRKLLAAIRHATGPISPAELARILGKDANTVTQMLKRMHAAGQVQRPSYGLYNITRHCHSLYHPDGVSDNDGVCIRSKEESPTPFEDRPGIRPAPSDKGEATPSTPTLPALHSLHSLHSFPLYGEDAPSKEGKEVEKGIEMVEGNELHEGWRTPFDND
jgi:hypothetical protein